MPDTAYPKPLEKLITEFAKLPGIGRRSAERLAFYILKSDEPTALALAHAVHEVKKSLRHCHNCWHLADADLCNICSDTSRDRGLVLVVEQPRDLLALEATGMYKGLYHVLMGRLAPLEGIGPDALTLSRLFERVRDAGTNPGKVAVREIILGLNPTLEGDGTALYITDALKNTKVQVSRLARGLPSGSQLEYASKAVLADAIHHRQGLGQ